MALIDPLACTRECAQRFTYIMFNSHNKSAWWELYYLHLTFGEKGLRSKTTNPWLSAIKWWALTSDLCCRSPEP